MKPEFATPRKFPTWLEIWLDRLWRALENSSSSSSCSSSSRSSSHSSVSESSKSSASSGSSLSSGSSQSSSVSSASSSSSYSSNSSKSSFSSFSSNSSSSESSTSSSSWTTEHVGVVHWSVGGDFIVGWEPPGTSSSSVSTSSDSSQSTSESDSSGSSSHSSSTSFSSVSSSISSDLTVVEVSSHSSESSLIIKSTSSVSSPSELSSNSSFTTLLKDSSSSCSSQSDAPLPENQTRHAVVVSIQDYPGTANDLVSMNRNMDTFSSILINDYGFTVTRLMDVNATRANVVQAINDATANLVAGDAFVFAYSGHGSRPVDTNGDEADGYDEALFLYDSATLGGWKDDYLRNTIDAIPVGVKVTIVIEACYSGTVTRHLRNKGISEEDMREILIASSADNESSWPDFWTKRGVFSNALIKALQASGNKVTVQVLFNRIVSSMSAPVVGKPQHPQLEGPAELKQARAFV